MRGPDLAGVFKMRSHKIDVKLAYHSSLCPISAGTFNWPQDLICRVYFCILACYVDFFVDDLFMSFRFVSNGNGKPPTLWECLL